MIKSPNRRDTSNVYALVEEMPQLCSDDFENLEKAGCCKLNKQQKKDITNALECYVLKESISKKAYTRGELDSYLNKIISATETLDDIFSDEQGHAKRVSSLKINDEFEETIGDIGFEMNSRWDLVRKYYCGDLKINQQDHIDFQHFADNCLIISHAAKRALKKMENTPLDDSGGKEPESLKNNLLLSLRSIYDESEGKKRAYERFVMECCKLIPSDCRPVFPEKPGSIDRQLQRISK